MPTGTPKANSGKAWEAVAWRKLPECCKTTYYQKEATPAIPTAQAWTIAVGVALDVLQKMQPVLGAIDVDTSALSAYLTPLPMSQLHQDSPFLNTFSNMKTLRRYLDTIDNASDNVWEVHV